jgi:hypothetical protein
MSKSTLAIPTPASADVSRWNVRNRICRAIIAGATVLSLAASALTIEPATAGAAGTTVVAPSGSARARANRHRSSRCWQVRPIYSASGAWLDNRRVNVCH